ncbi:NAD-dependent epimerase/dehydratase family protein [Microbacterium sp. CFH 31415]|uniref:NAD-dependent epimerase/dehydratase family protein n=1 Tax=Microbacterium sp. CFH 31415 TaxID=2921732 RepID=UPI001F12E0DD|nr:NAD-dependent epimerase/dehydratase family protein [Microbacterium sp. CFH 31415]MCH6231719.1 NAD-dependent epimerase/dehydratase family protein [Microbacterium sp. CFH 31415]
MNSLSASTVLVTGGAGRLGRLVVTALRARGIRTLSLSRGTIEHPDDLRADLTDADGVISAVADGDVDIIVHLAAAVHRDNSLESGARMDASLDRLIRTKLPHAVVFASTGAVYGDRSTEAVTEESPTLGTSPYALSKLSSENALHALTLGMPELSVTTLRIFNVAGPDFPTSLVQRLLAADPAHPATLIRPDSYVRDYIHQADVVNIILAAMDDPEPGYHLLNVGAGQPIPTRSLLSSLDISDSAWVEVDGEESSNWCDNAPLVRSFGIAPRVLPTRAWGLRDPSA